ncbi:UNVERIFIED_CONTAM: hypothetical protein FKN15_023774 [Acipenser sinensis]
MLHSQLSLPCATTTCVSSATATAGVPHADASTAGCTSGGASISTVSIAAARVVTAGMPRTIASVAMARVLANAATSSICAAGMPRPAISVGDTLAVMCAVHKGGGVWQCGRVKALLVHGQVTGDAHARYY